MPNQIVVAGAVVAESKVLIAQRVRPPELAGRWELPGGKVAAGETEPEALVRGEPHPHDHSALRWVSAAQLHEVDWVPADRGFLAALDRLLHS